MALTTFRISAAICSSELELTKRRIPGARSLPVPLPPWQTEQRVAKLRAPVAGGCCAAAPSAQTKRHTRDFRMVESIIQHEQHAATTSFQGRPVSEILHVISLF